MGPGEALGPAAPERILATPHHRVLSLDVVALRAHLAGAPVEGAREQGIVVTLPMPDGRLERFRVALSPILAPELGARFPEIHTYKGWGIDDKTASARFDWTPAGFHGMVLSARGTVYIDPWAKDDTRHYVAYDKKDYGRPGAPAWRCEAGATDLTAELRQRFGAPLPATPFGDTKRTYRLAVAADGEYTAFQGSQAAALAAIVTTMNRVNAIYEREVAVHMDLVADELDIIFTNAGTDPYINSDSECGSTGCANTANLDANQTTLDSVIGAANYDVGHVFTTSKGGRADIGVVCVDAGKARGVSGLSTPVGDPFDVDYVAHDLGHQFGAHHTFNAFTPGSCTGGGQRHAATAYEPGSGSTIMGFAGLCISENVQAHSDDYFHGASLDEIQAYLSTASVTLCATTAPTNDTPPTGVDAGPSHTIPIGTPFALTASATDPDGDPLTYAWEQMDLGTKSPPDTDDGTRPILRSRPPTLSPTRLFPTLSSVLGPPSVPDDCATTTFGFECLPATTRTLTFRATVRDGRSGTNSATTSLSVDSTSGPFVVTAPNTAVSWVGGSVHTVAWNPAGTDLAPVSCADVRISFSSDGGLTFPFVLAASTPNDGAEDVRLPQAATTQARIEVDASACGNVFFDISRPAFTVTTPTATLSISDATRAEGDSGSSNATFTVTLSPALTETLTVDFATADGTATAGSDYTTTTGTLTFAAGQTSQTLAVGVLGDNVDEPDETFTVTLGNVQGPATISDGTGVGTIVDDDPPPAISIGDVAQAEGNAGTTSAVFTLTLSNPSSMTVGASFATANGTATAGSDYAAATGTVSFAPGQTTQTLAVSIVGDDVFEADETFAVNLSAPTNATIGDGQGIGTITNDDPLPVASIADATVVEGDEGNVFALFAVSLANATSQVVAVDYATADGSAVAGSDYVAVSGTLTIPAGATTATIPIPVKGDLLLETDEVFLVNLTGATNATIGDGLAVGTIQDDDALPVVAIGDVTVAEGTGGTTNAVVPLTLSAATGVTVSVDYATANGSAVAGLDYVASSGTVSFAPGATTATLAVAVKGDTRREMNEALAVALANPVNAKLGRRHGQVTILDDDRASADPCLPIVVAPFTIGAPGCYFLATDVTTPARGGTALTIGADDVRLDLRGHVLSDTSGLGTEALGIAANDRTNVRIWGGTVQGFLRGIALDATGPYVSAQGLVVQRMVVRDSTETGIEIQGRGNKVIDNQVVRSGGSTALGDPTPVDAHGISVTGPGVLVTRNLISDTHGHAAGTAIAIDADAADTLSIVRNRISNPTRVSSIGVRATASSSVTVTLNRLSNLDFGVVFAGGTTGTATSNVMIHVDTPYVP